MTASAIISMISDLPRHARFPALQAWRRKKGLLDEARDQDPDEGAIERLEMRIWGTMERELLAGQLNTLNDIVRFAPQWKKTPPAADVVGPPEWWPKEQLRARGRLPNETKDTAKGASIEDAMSVFGWVTQ